MKTRTSTIAAAAVLGALLGAGGCADNRTSISIRALCMPPTDCAFTDTCGDSYVGYPAFDRTTALTRGAEYRDVMSVYVEVANQLPSNADTSAGRLNSNDAHVDTIAVDYEGAVIGSSEDGTQKYVPAAGTSVLKIPLRMTGTGVGEALARVRLRGYYDNGSRFETGEYTLSINVCNGCAPAACAIGTCPPDGEGQRPMTCLE